MRGRVVGESLCRRLECRARSGSLFSSISSLGADGRLLMPIAIALSNCFALHRVQLHLTIKGSVSRGLI
jgi:hypothetical protein